MDIALLLFRWMHILAAITAVGGTIFMRVALLPVVSELPDAERERFHQGIRSRWAMVVHGSILFLLISGFYNFFFFSLVQHKGQSTYQMLFGIKFLLALAIFFIATMLVGRSKASEKFKQNRRQWLTINMVLAIVLVCISGAMRMTPTISSTPQISHEAPNEIATPAVPGPT